MVNEDILLSLKVDDEIAIQNIVKLTQANNDLKKEIKDLNEQYKDDKSNAAYIAKVTQLNAQIKENTAGIRENSKEIKTNAAEVASADTSVNGMRARIADLTKAYNSLSSSAREGDVGKQISKELTALNESVNTANKSVGNFKDNIGNYPEVVQKMSVSNTAAGRAMDTLGITANTTAKTFAKDMVGGLRAVGTQMTALLSNPFIALLAGLAAIIMGIVAAIKRSDAAMTALQVAFAPITDFIDYVLEGIGKIAEGVAAAIEWVATLGGTVETSGQKAVRLMDEIEEKRRQNVIKTAQEEQKLALAREIAADKESYTADQRKKALTDVFNITKQQADRQKKLAEDELKQFMLENAHNKNTDEYADRLVELQANILKIETQRSENQRSLLKQYNKVNEEVKKNAEEDKKAQEEKAKKDAENHKKYLEMLADRAKKESEAFRAVEDLRNQLISDNEKKEIAQSKTSTKRTIEDLQEKLKTEKNLTAKAREEINEQIKLLTDKGEKDVQSIKDKYLYDKSLKNLEYNKNLNEQYRRMDVAGVEQTNEQIYASKLKSIEDNNKTELEKLKLQKDNKVITEDEYNKQVILKNAEKNASITETNAEWEAFEKERKLQALKDNYANELSIIDENSSRATEIKKAQLDLDMKNELKAAEKSGADTLLIEKKYAKLKQNVDKQVNQAKLDAALSVAGSLKSVFKQGTAAYKVAASAEAAISTYNAANKALAAYPPPFSYIAAGATVAAGIANVVKIINTKEDGGNAASSATATQTTPTTATTGLNLPSLSGLYKTTADTTETSQKILETQPTPVVRVSEINEVQNTVKVKELSKI